MFYRATLHLSKPGFMLLKHPSCHRALVYDAVSVVVVAAVVVGVVVLFDNCGSDDDDDDDSGKESFCVEHRN